MVSSLRAFVAMLGGFTAVLSGCQLIGDIGDRTLAEAPAPECTTNQQCIDRLTLAGPDLTNAPADYTGLLNGVVPAVCVRPEGKCRPLFTPDCRTLNGDPTNDNAIVVGTYLTVSGTLMSSNIPRQQSAVLAAEEINSTIAGGGIPPAQGSKARRPLVVLNCDPSVDPLRTARHLAEDLHVPAVVGPNVAEDIISVTQEVSASGDMLLMSPTAPPDPITNLVDNDLTWRAVPSDSQRVKLLIDQIDEVEELVRATRQKKLLKLAIPYRDDALGISVRDAISGRLKFNGDYFISDTFNESYTKLDPFPLTDTARQAEIARKYAEEFVPDIVLVVANEVVPNIVVPLEKRLKELNPETPGPYYVAVDVAKVPAWLGIVKKPETTLANFRTRVRGIGLKPDELSASIFASFNTAYASRFGMNSGTSAMGPSYDSMYAIAYALAATTDRPVTGTSVAQGLRQLSAGAPISVGLTSAGDALQQLSQGNSIALRGTHTLMQWDSKGDIVGGSIEVWCIGLAGDEPAFLPSGKTMDVAAQRINGTYKQCE